MKSVTGLLGCIGFSPLLLVLGRKSRHRLLIPLLLGVLAATTARSQQTSNEISSNQQPSGKTETELSPASKQQILASYGRLPLSFEVNRGQIADKVKFLSRRPGFSLFLTATEAVLAFSQPVAEGNPGTLHGARPVTPRKVLTNALRIKLVGANPAPSVDGLEELGTKSNYFIGNDPKKWQTNVPNYAKVKYASVYPGVDVVYYGNHRQLEHDFIVAPGADPRAITLGFDTREKLRIDERGDVVVKGKIGEVRLEKPVVYQEVGGVRQQVAARYVQRGRNQIGFRIGTYDVTKTLMIDPVLGYSTYVSPGLPSGDDNATGIAVDSAGSAYVVGTVDGPYFPTTPGAFQAALACNCFFVMKLNPAGSAVIYSTYLGGQRWGSPGPGIAVDSAGLAYITGGTNSSSFPTTPGAFQTSLMGGANVFVTKLNDTGSGLVYSTLLGGSGNDDGVAIAVDSAGSAYVTGDSVSLNNFPVTSAAYQRTNDTGNGLCFVTKLNAFGTALDYSTYLGTKGYGTGPSYCRGIAVDSAGSAYVTGYTESGNFPTTPGAFQTFSSPASAFSAFVTKLTADGSNLVYSTYLTGNSNGVETGGGGIAVDSAGSAYVTGSAGSPNSSFPASRFPTTPGAFQTTFSGPSGSGDFFITKLTPDGSDVVYSTYLGSRGGNGFGCGNNNCPSIAVDSAGSASVAGLINGGTPFIPTTPDAIQTYNPGGYGSAFVTKLTADGSGLIYSTYLGPTTYDGNNQGHAEGIAVDSAGSIYVTGFAGTSKFRTTAGAVYPVNNNADSGFVAKFDFSQPSVSLSPISLAFPDTAVGQSSVAQTVTFSASGAGALAFRNIAVTGTNAGDFAITSNGCGGATLAANTANSSCQGQVAFTPTAAGPRSATLQFTYDGSGSPQTVSLSGTGLSQASTTTTLTSSLNSAQFGQSVTFTATPSSSAAGTPTGTVAFYDGATSLGSSVLSGTQATFSISSLSVGTHSITAVYGGDTNFNSSTSLAVTQTINKATPMISWTVPVAITYGTPLSATQLNATANVAGTFNYSPASGAVLNAGSQTLTVNFTPSDGTDYTTATANVSLPVNQAAPVITWATPAAITYGTALSSAQLDATANVPGTFLYTPGSGTLSAGTQTLKVSFTPTDSTDYTSATTSVQLVVNQATPAITWATPAAITYGTALSSTQLNATASVAGTLAYSPTAGTVLGAGNQTLSATFTPTDTTDYTAATGSVTLVVNKATPTVSWATPAAITYGTSLSSTQLDATASVPGTFSYSPGAGTQLSAGTQALKGSFTPTDSTDYASATASVQLVVNQATPAVTWATPAAITFGTTLSSTQLNATASVPGTFSHTPGAGTQLSVGTQTLKASFAPTDSTDYTSATASVQLVVGAAVTATNVSASPQPVKYSDYTTLTATVSPVTVGTQALTGNVQFYLNGSTKGSPVSINSSGVATLSAVQVNLQAGSYSVKAVFSSSNPNFGGNTGTTTQNVTQENAFVSYSGGTIAQVGTLLTLRATVWDSAAPGYPGTNPETGPNATIGDITNMYIAFDYYPAGTCGTGPPLTLYAQVAVTSTPGVGTATTTLTSSSEVSYCVVPRVVAGNGGTNLFYMAPSVQPVGVDFYVNSGQVATGGGWVWDPTGSHGNFSFNARYNSNGSPKGQKVYTYRGSYNGVPADFIITSNALTGLRFSGTTYPISATLQGKASIQINSASNGSVLFSAGNYTFSATVTDSGQNGPSGKQFSVTVYDPSGVVYHSVPAGTPLQGGNVVVHSQ